MIWPQWSRDWSYIPPPFHLILFRLIFISTGVISFLFFLLSTDIDGAFFGPTFPNLFFMTYEDVVPEPVAEQVRHCFTK